MIVKERLNHRLAGSSPILVVGCPMPNDAKFGLIVGLSLVLSAAILFFQKDQPAASAPPPPAICTPAPAPSTAAMLPSPAPLPRPGVDRDAPGQTASRPAGMW